MDKRYIYFAMGFSVFVEMINIRIRGKGPTGELHRPSAEE
jgi:predicted tellurium resistance membrane protein TerC